MEHAGGLGQFEFHLRRICWVGGGGGYTWRQLTGTFWPTFIWDRLRNLRKSWMQKLRCRNLWDTLRVVRLFYIKRVNGKWLFRSGQLDFFLKHFSSHFDTLSSPEGARRLPAHGPGEPSTRARQSFSIRCLCMQMLQSRLYWGHNFWHSPKAKGSYGQRNASRIDGSAASLKSDLGITDD